MVNDKVSQFQQQTTAMWTDKVLSNIINKQIALESAWT